MKGSKRHCLESAPTVCSHLPPEACSKLSIRKALNSMVHGLAVVTTVLDDILYGMTAAWIARALNEPFMISVAMSAKSNTREKILISKVFALNILAENERDLALHFGTQSGSIVNKFEGIKVFRGITGSPLLQAGAVAILDCRLKKKLQTGDHTLLIGEVIYGSRLEKIKSAVYIPKLFW